ncbi:hypothetical protein psyc5s11_07720 [Clostridium gelidum]|uniref:DUF445 family protein n=1 Tax=Clostridium gelidum TaxID=704125 RepID=A0ABM7T1E6_9CLOT|nr:DUF445 family protein [Clostridium gelidum]BCZ44705.1 hypothetical protein psyc5s11_07720 [Clostridium gelidum]
MWKSLFLLVFQGISGGVAGYITNKYAVNMLFKEYTPLKLGGVIKKKKEKFIEEISELVERDIINAETLKAEISKKDLNNYIEQIAGTFFQTGLNESLGNTKLCEVTDFSNSILKSEEFARKNLNTNLPKLLDNIFVNVKLDDVLTENQISKIVDSSYDLLVQELENSDTLNEFISSFYKENSNITLSDIFSKEVQRNFTQNITKRVIEIIKEDILEDEEGCKLFFDKIFSAINIDVTLIKLQGLIGDYEINQFVTNSEEEEFTLKLFGKVNEFINSEKGKELIKNLMDEIFLIGKDIDFTVYEILPPEMEKSLTNFIETVIPKVMPYISEWISGNKESLDEMIEAAIDEAIKDVDGNIKKLIISKVRSALMGDISSKNNIVNKIINYLNDSFDGESYNKLANSIIDYLKSKKIKDIVALLENQNLFNSEKLAELIIKEFGVHGEKLLGTIIKSQFLKKIHNVFKFDLVKLFHEKIKPMLYENIFKNKAKLSEKINDITRDFINSKNNEVFNEKLSDLFTQDQVSNFSNNFAKLTNKSFVKNAPIYKTQIADFLSLNIKNLNLEGILKNYKADICELIVDKSMVVYKETVDKYKKYEITQLINTYFDSKTLSNLLINKGYPMLMDKLPDLLNGNIKKFASNNLKKYDEDEICNIVQDFMGGQLKPLSVFGAFLGVIVGVLYELIHPTILGNFGFASSLSDMAISCAVMAFIGYITNVIALWMIFHPYKENKIVSKIPFLKKFALGYIPAHKNEFAIGMAKLIDDELLNKEEINKVFKVKHNNMKSVLMMLVTNNNYQILINLLRDKKQDLSKYIYEKILKYCKHNSYLAKRISKAITNSKFNEFIKKDHVLNIVPNLVDKIKDIEDTLVQFAERKLSENNRVKDILPKGVSVGIQNYVETEMNTLISEKVQSTKNIDFVNKIIDNYSSTYDLEIQKSCKEIFSEELLFNIKNNMETRFETYVFNDLKIHVNDFAKQFLRSGLDENNTIGSMFNGKVKSIVDNNLYLLTSYITKKSINYVQNKQDDIALNVQETIKNELNFFEKMAYGAFGGDDIANKVVSIILNEKLPIMIKDETDKIISIAKVTLNDSVYPMKTSILKIKADEFNITILLDNVFEQFNKNNSAKQHIRNSGNLIMDSLIKAPIIEYLELCNLNSLDLVYKKFYNEVTIVKEDIYNNINNNSSELSQIMGELLNEKIAKPLFNSYNSLIFEGITSSDIKGSVKSILNLISSSKETEKYLGIFLEKAYDNTLSELSIEQIVDADILNKDIEKIIKSVFGNEVFNENNISLIKNIIQNAIDNKLDFITADTKDYLTDKTIEAGLYSISDYIVPILKEINLKNITNKQIELLNPKEIDILFNSFAGDFFNKLRIYGVWGFVFGINVGLSIILWALDWRYSKDPSKKDLNTLEDL